MRIAVVGASGRSGRALVRLARLRSHTVAAVVRDRGRLDGLEAEEVFESRTWDSGFLASAFARADAVAFCVGPVPGGSRTVQQDLITPTLDAMHACGVRRLAAISASGGVVDGDDPLNRFVAKPILARVLRDSNADMAAMEDRIRAGGLDWTILRPPKLTDRPGSGRYRSRRDGNVRWGYTISRADLAHAVLDALEDRSAIGQTISIAG
ncbi:MULTISPECIES: NAD(P)-dependent oxidoreductase [unclassified Nocardiopsis]|uniref:NAD(P)-dependent oxidoreductase n=1 Tax=Nocardiopsis TaxID=2013 RepID=UPI00387B4F2C